MPMVITGVLDGTGAQDWALLHQTAGLVANDAVQSGYGKSGIPSSFRNSLCFSVAFLIALSIPTSST